MDRETRLSDEQQKAIKSLERALRKCDGCGIALFGTGDNDMCAFDATDVLLTGFGKPDVDILEALKSLGQGQTVNDGGAYWDSIAW